MNTFSHPEPPDPFVLLVFCRPFSETFIVCHFGKGKLNLFTFRIGKTQHGSFINMVFKLYVQSHVILPVFSEVFIPEL